MIRDPFGLHRLYYDLEGRATAPTIRRLFAALPDLPRTLDPLTATAHLGGRALPRDRSPFAAIRAVEPGHALVRDPQGWRTIPAEPVPAAGHLGALLSAALRPLPAAGQAAVALSGGLDSAIVLALVHAIDPAVPALVLEAQLDRYGELDEARATADQIGAPMIVAHVDAADFRAALPDAIAAMEAPLYNLHPVSKLLFARAARRCGFTTVFTGDGADQLLSRDRSADYLPLVSAAFASAGVELRAPFLDPRVVAHFLGAPPDPEKQALRQLAAALPIREALVRGRKVSRLTPPIDLHDVVEECALRRLASATGLQPPTQRDDRDPACQTRWITLALLCRAFSVGS
jgi:asparagine synthetase B (glutamine-hydrolysing)